jgi:hypothetical protein
MEVLYKFPKTERKTYSEKRIVYSTGYEYFYYSSSYQIHLEESSAKQPYL